MKALIPTPLHIYSIFEVLELGGPIVTFDKASGTVITLNKAAFQAWTSLDEGFVGSNTCLITQLPKVGDCTDFGLIQDVARDWLKELLEDSENEEPSNA